MSWTSGHLEALRGYIAKFKVRSFVHTRAATHFSFWYKCTIIPSIIFGVVGTSTLFSTDSYNIVAGCCTLTSTMLTGISSMMELEKQRAKHLTVSQEFEVLANEVQAVLLANDKPDPDVYIRDLTQRVGMLIQTSPMLPERIIDKYLHDLNRETEQVGAIVNMGATVTRARSRRRPSEDFYQTAVQKEKERKIDVIVERFKERGSASVAESQSELEAKLDDA